MLRRGISALGSQLSGQGICSVQSSISQYRGEKYLGQLPVLVCFVYVVRTADLQELLRQRSVSICKLRSPARDGCCGSSRQRINNLFSVSYRLLGSSPASGAIALQSLKLGLPALLPIGAIR